MRKKRKHLRAFDTTLELFPVELGPVTFDATTQQKNRPLTVCGLFAGVGGIEIGLNSAGHQTNLLCENDLGAIEVLRSRMPHIPLHDDVLTLKSLPVGTDMVAGGFPCQDLSQAGTTAGIIEGKRSSLVGEVFRLLRKQEVPWVLLENVKFMLNLQRGLAMNVLTQTFEELGYKWAYRVVNSLAFGVPQRRNRVVFLASLVADPREVLFADACDDPGIETDPVGRLACGFYWTEGIRGLGWAVDSVPTLKGGSTIGIPSPPAILFRNGLVATPDIRDAERMQGLPVDWTEPSTRVTKASHRWKLVGNAVTSSVFAWVGRRLIEPLRQGALTQGCPLVSSFGWPDAAWNVGCGRFEAKISAFPVNEQRPKLEEWLLYPPKPLSLRAITGFLKRTEVSDLRFRPGFLEGLTKHRDSMESQMRAGLEKA